MRSARLRPLAPLLAGGLLAACQFGPQRPVPDPLPEVLAWTREAAAPEVFLGLEVRENDSGSLDDLFFAPGVRVVEVAPGSPAEAAGIERGDVVLTVQGEEVLDPAGLRSRLDALGAVKLILEVQRGDSVFEVAAEARTLESARAAAEPARPATPKPAAEADPDTERLERRLSEQVGAPVSIKRGSGGAGQLVIRYSSLDELEGILAHIR